MNLGLENKSARFKNDIWKGEYYESFTKKAKEFWMDRNVETSTLQEYGVKQLKRLTFKQANGNYSKFDYHKNGTTAFEFTVNGRKKLYVPSGPNPKLSKKYYCKTQNNNDIFGLRQLPRKKQKFLLICEGEGDVLCAAAHGLPAVCFQSANTRITKPQLRTLRQKASNLVLCYDLDEPGRKAASKLTWDFPNLMDLKIPENDSYSVGTGKKETGLILYWIDMTDDQLMEYGIDEVKKPTASYKDLSDWLPKAHVSDFRSIIDRVIKDGKKQRFLHIWENGYSYMKFNQKSGQQEEVSNFLIEADAQILKEDASFRLVRFLSRSYKTDTLAVPSNLFNSPDKLSEYLSKLRGNFRFDGTKKDLIAIQKMTFELSDYLEEVSMMGWNKKHHCFVLSNAVLNGKVETPNSEGILRDMYIPVANDANTDNSSFATDMKYRMLDDCKYKEPYQFFNIIATSYNDQVATMSFSFLFAGLFFDWIARKGMSNQFPLFGVFGQKGSGKGSLIKLLMKPFTSDPEEVSVTNASKTGFIRTLEQASNIPAWLDEFRNSLPSEKIEALKNIFDLIGKVIGTKSNDSKTKRSKILRPTFLSGQESPVNEALFSRVISLNLPIVQKSPTHIRQFSADMTELDKGIGAILFKLLGYRKVVTENFKDQFFDLVEWFGDEVAAKGVKANIRLLNNYACVMSPIIIAINNGLKLSKDGPEVAIKAVKKHALATLIEQATEESQLDEVNKFLEVVVMAATLATPTLYPGIDFKVEDGKVIIKMAVVSMFNKMYEEFFKHRGPDQSAIKKYLIHKPYFIKKDKYYFFTGKNRKERSQLWSMVLDLEKLPEETQTYFESVAKNQTPAYAISN